MGIVWQFVYLVVGCLAVASVSSEEVAETKERRDVVNFEKHFTDDEDYDDHGGGNYGGATHSYGGFYGASIGDHGGSYGDHGGSHGGYGGSHGGHGGSYGDHEGYAKATSYQKVILHAGHPVKVFLKPGGYGGYGDYSHGNGGHGHGNGGQGHGNGGYGHAYSGGQGHHGYSDHGPYTSHDYDSGARDYNHRAGGFDHSSFGTGDHVDH